MLENKLIFIYCRICQLCKYSTVANEMQRISNNCRPKFTDEEVLTCYIWGVLSGKSSVKHAYHFIRDYWGGWFPLLPKYHAFNHRMNELCDVLPLILWLLMPTLPCAVPTIEHVLDSIPIVVANSRRSGTARAASDVCDKGYCASKDMYYYGAKVHFLGMLHPGSIPKPVAACISRASESDITVAKEWVDRSFAGFKIFADKAYIDKDWRETLKSEYNITVVTPVKLAKGQRFLDAADELFSSVVSSIRQPIESIFNWINEKVNLQNASKVRSRKSLMVHVFGKLLAVCCEFAFNF